MVRQTDLFSAGLLCKLFDSFVFHRLRTSHSAASSEAVEDIIYPEMGENLFLLKVFQYISLSVLSGKGPLSLWTVTMIVF